MNIAALSVLNGAFMLNIFILHVRQGSRQYFSKHYVFGCFDPAWLTLMTI